MDLIKRPIAIIVSGGDVLGKEELIGISHGI
jgi:hypothetical protein